MSTILKYLYHMHDLESDAYVERVEQRDGRTIVYLDQTILYPQGGGQPYDIGSIHSPDTTFTVEEVRYADSDVLHYGHFSGRPFTQGEAVHIQVNADRRKLNAQLHSAGHLVDMAIAQLNLSWIPQKGYHFPDGPYVEYDGQMESDQQEQLRLDIKRVGNELIKQDLPVSCRFVDRGELQHLCRHVPENIPEGKPTRIVQFADFAIPCGGTHVGSLAELRYLQVTKLKQKGHIIRVSYDIER